MRETDSVADDGKMACEPDRAEARRADDQEGGGEWEAGREPPHHARRPMNAFLIFCKRHRSVVREKYPNLENRSITKILGEWWANLEKEEKASYTGLAKQYKDAFFNANPDFKWYKLPAPPLRTLMTRPINYPQNIYDKANESAITSHEIAKPDDEKTNNNSTKYDFNQKPTAAGHTFVCESRALSMFTPGKLADEANMGGLSSLISSKQLDSQVVKTDPELYHTVSARNVKDYDKNNIYSQEIPRKPPYPPLEGRHSDSGETARKGASNEDSIRELQNALSETSRIFEQAFDSARTDNNSFKREENETKVPVSDEGKITNQELIDQIVDKKLMYKESMVENEGPCDGYRASEEKYGPNIQKGSWSVEEERQARTAGRACKGKRYQEFMAYGGLLVNKRPRRDFQGEGKMLDQGGEYSSNPSCSWDQINISDDNHYHKSYEHNQKDYYIVHDVEMVKRDPDENASESNVSDSNGNKMFKASDFDLDAKIRALPSLSLEKFQQRKKENKKRKKTLLIRTKEFRPKTFTLVSPLSETTVEMKSPMKPSDPSALAKDKRLEMAEKWREAIIGSKKRKQRKTSITRLSDVLAKPKLLGDQGSICMKLPVHQEISTSIANIAEDTTILQPETGLDALATLAEVAACTSKIEENL